MINLTQANIAMRNSLVRLLSRIHSEDGIPVASMSLVETCSFIFRPAPYFKDPIGTNENMSILDENGKDLRRKTCVYGPKSFVFVPADNDAKVESTTVINHWWQRCDRDRKLKRRSICCW